MIRGDYKFLGCYNPGSASTTIGVMIRRLVDLGLILVVAKVSVDLPNSYLY
jgi:hypothetical protein